MSFTFNEISKKEFSQNICVTTYEISSKYKDNLEEYLKNKIKKIKPISSFYNLFNPLLDANFIKLLDDNLDFKKIKHFNKKREFVTEFMAQALLEKEKGMTFFEEIDKRINIDFVNMGKSTDGIDVPGILLGEDFKFVVCEVKASDMDLSKVDSSINLLNEIKGASLNEKGRLLTELYNFLMNIPNIENPNKDILDFMINLISNINSSDKVDGIINKNVIFVPFLIRKKRDDIEDFLDIVSYDCLKDKEVTGIIWGVEHNITDFCTNIFDKAILEIS